MDEARDCADCGWINESGKTKARISPKRVYLLSCLSSCLKNNPRAPSTLLRPGSQLTTSGLKPLRWRWCCSDTKSRLQNYRFVSGHDFSRAVYAPTWIPALAAAELHVVENKNAGAKQAAEKLSCCQVLCQGTTLVVPIEAKTNFRL